MDINVIDYEDLINYIKKCDEKTALNISISKYLVHVYDYHKNNFNLISKIIEIIVKLDPEIMKRSTIGWEVDVNIDVNQEKITIPSYLVNLKYEG
jgi:hypothetical protein